jgi:hypothetical protein
MNKNIDHLPRTLHPCTWMKNNKFSYFNSERPYLVLYTMAHKNWRADLHGENGDFESMPNFKDKKNWVSIMHQTAGYACHSYYLHAQFIPPKLNIKEGLYYELLEKYNDSCISRTPPLKTAVEYENLLKKYNLTSNDSYHYLEEGFYPIDIDCLKKVTNQKFPEDLQNLIVKPREKKKLWSLLDYAQFGLAILGPNCD